MDEPTWTEECGEWKAPSLVIDTNTYAGNFERELCAACTGQTGECGVGQEEADRYDGPDMGDVVSRAPDKHGCWRPVAIYPTPGRANNGMGKHGDAAAHPTWRHPAYESVRIFLTRDPTPEELAGIKARAEAFSTRGGRFGNTFKITGYRIVQERATSRSRPA